MGNLMRRRAPILQAPAALKPEAGQPLVAGSRTEPRGRSGATNRPSLSQDSLHQKPAGVRTATRVRMKSHSGAPSGNLVGLATPFFQRALSEQGS